MKVVEEADRKVFHGILDRFGDFATEGVLMQVYTSLHGPVTYLGEPKWAAMDEYCQQVSRPRSVPQRTALF